MASLNPTNQTHRKLQHLHSASRLLFASAPAVSAHIACRLRSAAAASNVPLSDAVFRSQCACCGSLLVPGWTAKVRIRGYKVREGDKEAGTERLERVTRGGSCTEEVDEGAPHSIHAGGAKGREVIGSKGEHSGGRSRRAGRSSTDEQLDQAEDGREEAKHMSRVKDVVDQTTMQEKKRRKRQKKKKIKSAENKVAKTKPRLTGVYTCLLCDRKTTHAVPAPTVPALKAVANLLSSATIATPTVTDVPKSTTAGTGTVASAAKPATGSNPAQVAASSPANAGSKKRAKQRKKGTLSDLLSKEKHRADNSGGGFGLDLMDFMKMT